MSDHTKGEWRVKPGQPFTVEARDGKGDLENAIVAMTRVQKTWQSTFAPPKEEAKANARLIVRAVNSHDELLAVLREFETAMAGVPNAGNVHDDMATRLGWLDRVRKKALAALAKAEKEP